MKLFQTCDELRDDKLPELSVSLEDLDTGASFKFVDREILLKEREERIKIAQDKAAVN